MTQNQPRIDILSKALRERQAADKNIVDKDPQMKAIAELQLRWQNIWLRAAKHKANLEDALSQLIDVGDLFGRSPTSSNVAALIFRASLLFFEAKSRQHFGFRFYAAVLKKAAVV